MPLARSVDSALRVDIEMFSRGGLAVLDAIEATGYNTLERRPSISKSKQLRLLVRALALTAFSRCAAASAGRLPERLRPTGQFDCRERSRGRIATCVSWHCHGRRVALPTRNAAAWRARPPAISTTRFFMLAAAKRDALCALYAFMRLVDDVSDERRRALEQAARPRALARGCSMQPWRATRAAIRSFPRLRTRSRAFRFRRAISTI